MAFVPLTDEEKRILQNEEPEEIEIPEESAGGLFGGIKVSSIPQVANARDRLPDLRREEIDAEADISAVMDPGLLNRGGAFTRMPAEEPPFQGAERLNLAPEGGTVVELSPEEKAVVAKEAPMAESTRFLAERFREAYNFGDPDAYAEDMKRASATGIPFHMVYNDNEMRQAADWQRSLERNLDGLSKLPPALVNWLRIPGRMELARDDIGTLAQLGELLRVEEYRKNTWNITQGYRGGTASMEMGDIGTKAIFGQATEADLKRMEELRESLALNDRTKGTTGDKLVSGLGYTVGLRQEQFRTMADKALLYGAYGAGLAGLFGQAGPQVALPEELITVPAGFMFGARYGAGLGALTKGFAMEAGNAYWEFKEIRDEEGNFLPEELIRVGAILYGIGSSGLEALQAGKLAKVVPGMGRLLTREGISTLLKTPTFRDAVMAFFKEYTGDLTFEVLTEGAQKGWQLVVGEFLKNEQNVRELGDALGVNSDDMYGWMQQAGGIVPDPEKLGFTGERGTFEPTTFAAAMDDVWKEVSEATYSFALGLVPGSGINFVSNSLAVSRAKDMQARFNTIAGLTQESRLAKRFPPAWREAIQTMVKDGPIAEVGIDANVFYDTLNQEGLNPTEVALQLGVKAEDLEEARKNKTDIWVETGAYAEHVAGTELHDRLHQDIRVGGPEELTLREATAREKELRGQFNDAVEEASRALEASGADRAQLEEIQANVREQLQSLGAKWLKPNVVEGYATLWAHMAQQAAKRWGITPREWAERISLKIVDGEDGTKRLTASYDQQAGRFSATMDRDLLERAEQMWASGQDADAIWQATGWEMGTDGKWRYEISDAEATVSANWVQGEKTLGESMVDVPNLKLESILHHPKLFAAYPLLKRTRIEYQKSLDAIASYEPDTRRITFGPEFLKLDTEEAIKTLLHEVQHGIQVTESFAQGGSTEMIGERARLIREEMAAARQDPAYQASRREYNEMLQRVRKGEISMEEADAYWANVENTVESAATEKRLRDELNRLGLLQKGDNARTRFDAYRRLYGEAEARATELRSTWTDEQLAAEPFSATLKRMLVAEGLATEDQSLADATLVVNPGEEYEIEIPFRVPATFEQNAGTGAYYEFLNPLGKNPELKRNLTRAKMMTTKGKRTAEEIFRATGWWMGLDGKWRWVIDDSQATFIAEFLQGRNILEAVMERITQGEPVTLGDILDHPALFDAYPDLMNIPILIDETRRASSYQSMSITLGGDKHGNADELNMDVMETLMHEIQHYIQQRENFNRGGTMRMVADRIRALQDVYRNGTREQRAAAEAELKRFKTPKKDGEYNEDFESQEGRERVFDAYRLIYGEAEARATELRSKYSKEQIEAESPMQTLEKLLRGEGLLGSEETLEDVVLLPDIEQLNTDKAWSITERDALFDVDVVDAIAGSILDHEQGEANPDNVLLPPDGQTLFQVQNLEEYGGTWEPQIRKWMQKNGYAKDEIEKHLGAIRGQMAIFSALGPVQLELLPQGANLNRGKAKGPIRKNDDPIYKISFDASAMCPKRLSAAATAFEVQKRIGRALTASERMALVALYKAAGKAAPCIYCYVEAPRGKGSEFVKTGLDVVQGLKEPGKKWSKATKELALAARKEYANLGLQEGDIDVNVILDQEYASTDEAAQKLIQAPMVYKFLKSQMLSAKANLPKLYEEYSGQILNIPDNILDELNGYAGLRFFSSSDFQEGHIADLMQAFIDMSIRLAKSHSYTKVEDYVRIFGRTGQKIQTSIFAREENGEIVMDDWQGMDWETAKAFREQFPDVGTILVAASDNIVQWALEQDWIDYIIPFHYSGLEKRFYETMGWMDFTSTQTEKSIDGKKKVQKIRMFETGSEKGISNEDGTRNYLKLALERRLYPVFPAFIFRDGMDPVYSKNGKKLLANQRKAQTDRAKARWKEMVEKGEIDWSQINMSYYKLRKDYARTDTPFNAVKPDFDMKAAEAAFERFMKGEAPGAKVETEIADDLVDLIAEHGDTVGIWALAKVQQHEPLGPSSKGWPAAWDASPDTADRTFFQGDTDTDYLSRYRLASRPVEGTLQIYDEEFSDAGSLVEGVKRGDLLVHARRWGEIDLVELEYGLEPTIGKTLGDTEAAREAAEVGIPVPPLVFASDSLNWIGGDRDGVVFLRKDGFQKSLGDGRVELPDGRIVPYERSPLADYESDSLRSEPVGVEKGDWYTTKTAEVVGVAQWRSSENVAYRLAENRDADYLSAVEAGDMETAQKLVLEAARAAGYISDTDYRMMHRAPNSRDDVSLLNLRESGLVPADYWTKPEWYQHAKSEWASWRTVTAAMRKMDAAALKGKDPGAVTITMYRAVPKTVTENSFRNGDWVTPSRADAVNEGQMIPEGYRIISRAVPAKNLYWDGNSINEWGYDDGQGYGYQNTPNNRKLLDAVTRDDAGNVIPLSQRFDTGTPDIRYQKRGRKQQPRGSITLQREWGAQEETVLTLTPNADKSTFLHEIGHLFLWDLEQLETSGLADEKTLEDLEALRAWWSDHVSDLAIWIRKQKSFPQELQDRLTGPGWEQRIQEAIRGRGDADVVKAVQVATQEYWARGIEAYLMEGVAPNTQLERLFAQFRTWLTGIYRALQGVPDVQLSDEVRAVMDRMVASEDAIEMARLKRESDKAAGAMLAEGVADREAEQYRAAAEQAAARAKTRLLKVLMGELQEDHKKKIETARADAEKRILPELLRLPHYRVYDRLRQWTHETGEWLSSAGLTEDQMDMVPEGLMTPEGGIDREVAADLLGVESEAELMALLAEARMRPLDQVLAEMVDAEVAPLESAMNNPELLQEQAEEALMGADRIRLLSLEREILQKKISKIEGITTQDSRTMAARAAAMTEQARDMFRGRTMRDAGAAARYMAEARRAGRQAFEAALAGRLEDALEAKDREMLFSALYLESKKLQEEREKNLRYLRKFWTGRQRLKPLVGEENLAQIQRILERYGFQQELPVEGRVPLGKWLGAANAQLGADLEETGVGIPVPDWMVAEDYRDERRSWKNLTVEEFGELHKAVKAIEHFGRTQGRLVAQEKQQNLQAWKDKLQANVVKVWGKLKPGSIDPNYEGAPSVSRFLAAHDRIEFLLRRLDGFEDLGPAWQLLFQPVVTAERSEIARMRSAKGAIEKIFSAYTAEERAEMRKKKYTTAQLDPQTQKPLVLSKENLLAMLLNWGARQNREEVVFGYGFDRTVFNRGQGRIHYADMEQYYEAFHRGEREVEALFAQVLTEKDYQIAQAVWDHNETYWDEVSAMVRDLTGVTPERVERLSVKSPSGTIYSGGYYHLAFKPESNIKTFALSEKAAITALYEPQGIFAMTRTGHTKARHHGQRGSRLLRLDLGVEVEHLRDVVHDLYFRPVVRDLNRLINDEQVQNIILSTLGFEAFRQLKPWVHGLATAYRPMDNYGEKVFRKLMGNTSAAILGWSMSSALNQTLGWFTVIPALGLKRTVRGIMDFYLHPTTWAEKKNFAFGKSEYLRDRVNTFDRDVKAAIEQVTESPVRGKWSAVQESFFLAAGWMDMGVSLPAWLAGYDAGMLKFNGDEAKAVEYADWIVRSSQNTGAAKDLSSIQRGGPLWKSLTMFYTAFNSIYNQSREQWFRGHGKEDLPRLAAYLVFQFVMPALLGDMMNRRGPDWDDDDPEDIWKWIFTSVLQYGSSQFIGLRDVVNAATSGFDYRMSPMADAGQSLARLMTGVGKVGSAALFGTEMPDLEQLGYRALDAAGTIWGIPSKQLQRTARGLVGLADDPDWSPVDLLLRKPRK